MISSWTSIAIFACDDKRDKHPQRPVIVRPTRDRLGLTGFLRRKRPWVQIPPLRPVCLFDPFRQGLAELFLLTEDERRGDGAGGTDKKRGLAF